MTRRIAITGPESTGKSMLAEQLAAYYNTAWVAEYAREYLGNIGRNYVEEDILVIAKGQLNSEEAKLKSAVNYLFCDTDMLVTKIWSDVKYGRCNPWINETMDVHRYDLHLLCDIDLPWQYDPLREHPDQRQYLFDLYYNELKNRNYPFEVIRGTGKDRMANAIQIIDKFAF